MNIIFLNGTSSSGKTGIAKALQEIMDGYYIHTGIDHYLERVPEKFHTVSDGKNPDVADGFLWIFPNGDRRVAEIRIGPAALRLLTGMYQAIAALSSAGNDLIVDDVIFDSQVLREAVNILHTFNVLFVGVRCPLEVAERREQERGDRTQGLAKSHYELVHAHGIYDLEVDTSILTPLEGALAVKNRLQSGSAPNAFSRLQSILGSR
jgi:chloramphenicol 3-O phosphotransferase